jgi:Zn-dependent peptidase ImmA (M78 family)
MRMRTVLLQARTSYTTLRLAAPGFSVNPTVTPRIWIYELLRYELKRLAIFHEWAHAIVPWHEQFDYPCRDMDMDPTVRRLIERQAYRCGSEFLFPREMFVQDSLSLEIGVAAIEQLRHRYAASMEATAIWYAHS